MVTANDPGNAKQISRLSCGAQFATQGAGAAVPGESMRNAAWYGRFVRFDHAGKDKTITYNDGSVHPVNTSV